MQTRVTAKNPLAVDGNVSGKICSSFTTFASSSSSSSTYGTDDASTDAMLGDSARSSDAEVRSPVIASISDFEDDDGAVSAANNAVIYGSESEGDFEVIPQSNVVSNVETLSEGCANGGDDGHIHPMRLYIRLNNGREADCN